MRHPGYLLYLVAFFLLMPLLSSGQSTWVRTDTLLLKPGEGSALSHSFMVPYSTQVFTLSGEEVDTAQYVIQVNEGILIPRPSLIAGRYRVQYRIFSHTPKRELAIRKYQTVQDTATDATLIDVILDSTYGQATPPLWQASRIRKSGSLTRGLTAGNNRGLSVNSGLRLQLEGDLGNGLTIVGAITDENIPIQPDGTTQQISDFDKVFIKLIKDNKSSVTIGDYEVAQKGTYFADFYRNVQGLQVEYVDQHTRVQTSGAIAKGKFHTNSFMGREGVSGPYRLSGRNQERLFIILAGSEQVYLNGKRLTRGESQDYVINYNTGEITFTSRQVITSVSRIVVDFEYNDQYYNRSLMTAKVEHKALGDRLSVGVSYGRDADNPNAPFEDVEAYNAIRDSLAQVGDADGQVVTPGIFEAGYSAEEIRYARRDTVIGGVTFERYIYSLDSLDAIYQIRFSFVGAGQGFYERDASGVNNNVFRWVPPDEAARPTGDYAPIRSWVLPRMLQVTDAQLSYQISDKLRVYNETAISVEDNNRLSLLDDADNQGVASRSGLQWDRVRLGDSVSLSLDLHHQYVMARYINLDRVYRAEYNRIWDIETSEPRRDEIIWGGKAELNVRNELIFRAENGIRHTGGGRRAQRQVYGIQSNFPKGLQGIYTFTHIVNEHSSINRRSVWDRHEGDIFKNWGQLRTGMEVWLEDRTVSKADSLGKGSFSFVDLKPYIRTLETRSWKLDASLNYRKEREWLNGTVKEKSEGYTAFLRTAYTPSPRFRTELTTAYRVFEVKDQAFTEQGLSDSRVLNTNWQTNFIHPNRIIASNWVYDVSAEQVARRELRFIEVNPGQGQYEWIDFNENGLEEIDEFQLSTNPLLANYIRVNIPTRELFPTTKLGLTGNLRVDLSKAWEPSKKTFRELLRQTKSLTTLKVTQNKQRNTSLGSYVIDLTNIFDDSTLLNANYFFRQDFTFFQNSRLGDVRFSYQDNQSKLFLNTGDELRGLSFWSARQRLNFDESKSLEVDTRVGEKFATARNFPTREFNIRFVETRPKVNFQFNNKFRFSTGYTHTFRRNFTASAEENARVSLHKVLAESRWNLKDRNNLFTRLELIGVRQQGEPGFSAAYELREGLEPGFNMVWSSLLTLYVMSNVELTFTYEGRASAVAPAVHTGRVQVRAFF